MKALGKLYAGFFGRSAFWCLAAGLIYSLPYFNGGLFVFGFVGMLMLCLKLFDGETPAAHAFSNTFFFFVGFLIPLFSWFTALYPFEAFELTTPQGIGVVILAVFGITALQSLLAALVFCLLKLLPHRACLLPVGVGTCLALFEWVTGLTALALPWGTAAVGQYKFLPFVKNASLFGSPFIAFLVGMISAYAALCVIRRTKRLIVCTACALTVPLLAGSLLMLFKDTSSEPITVAAVQGNVLSMEKWDGSRLETIIENYRSLTEEAAASGAELIVLPESALPTAYNSVIHAKFKKIAVDYNCTIVMAAIVRSGGAKYNVLFTVFPDGTDGIADMYKKQHLVPFGEYLPMQSFLSSIFPFIGELNLSESAFTPGSDSNVIRLSDGTGLGCLICFDSVFPRYALESIENGAELIIVSTNDSWYEDSAGVYQHMAHSVVRAIETGRWIVRSANTGISCYISPNGVVSGATEPLVRTISYGTVYTSDSRTLYSYIGGWVMVPFFAYVIFGVATAIINKLSERKKKANESDTSL